MAYEIREENDSFNVYENGEYRGILSCPFEQTAEEFVSEMNQLGFTVLKREEIPNIAAFPKATETQQWDVFAIDPGDDVDEDDLDEDEEDEE